LFKINHMIDRLTERKSNGGVDGADHSNHDHEKADKSVGIWKRMMSLPLVSVDTCPCKYCREVTTERRHAEDWQRLIYTLEKFDITWRAYLKTKRESFWPYVHTWLPVVNIEHFDDRSVDRVHQHVKNILSSLRCLNDGRIDDVRTLTGRVKQEFDEMTTIVMRHIDSEEILLTPLFHQFADMATAVQTMRRMWRSVDVCTWHTAIPFILNHTPDNNMRMAFLDCFAWATDDAFVYIGRWLSQSCNAFLYARLCVDYPTLKDTDANWLSKTW